MSRARAAARTAVLLGSLGAVAATVHTAVNLRRLRTPSPTPPRVHERVSVLVPARDEAGHIGSCLSSVRAQADVPDLEVLVLDDRSTDGTAQVVAHHAAADARVRLIDGGTEPPPGWLGKPWACHRLADEATGSVLVFLDADVELAPQAVAATVDLLRTQGLDAVCPYPRQVAASPGERLVQPLLQWSWATFLPLRAAETSPRPSLVAANGQLLAVDSLAYRRGGGHAGVRGEVLEDIALLRTLKRAGGRGGVVDGATVARCHMYDSWRELQDGYGKSLWSAFGSPAGATAVLGALVLMYVVPPVAAVAGSRIGFVGYAAGVTGRALVAARVHGRVWPDSLVHPVSVVALTHLTARSFRLRRRGRLAWKGRALDTRSTTP